MFGTLAAATPDFLPPAEDRDWIARRWASVRERLGAPARIPRLITSPPGRVAPKNLDQLFEMLCALQEQIGQSKVDLEVVELAPSDSEMAKLVPIGDPRGHLLHTFARGSELVLVLSAALFRKDELLLGSVARELGRIGLFTADPASAIGSSLASAGGAARQGAALDKRPIADEDMLATLEADAEIAGIALGMGAWVVNGAYVFENACCGGGCGVDLRSVRAGLSMPEAAYAVALDSRAKSLSRFGCVRQLAPTQRAAFRSAWNHLPSETVKQLAAGVVPGAALEAGAAS